MFISRRPLCHENYANSNKRQEVDQLCSFAHHELIFWTLKCLQWKSCQIQTNVRKLIMSAHLTPFSIFKLPQAPGERSHPFCCFSFSEANLCQSAHILEYVSYSIIHNMYSTPVTLYTRCYASVLDYGTNINKIHTPYNSAHTPHYNTHKYNTI